MSVTYKGQKPTRLWQMRTRIRAFIAACKDKDTRHIARTMGRDGVLSTGSFVTAGLILKLSATAIVSTILSVGTPVAIAVGVIMGAKSYISYKKSAKTYKKSTHVRDGLLAVGAIGAGVFLLNAGAAALVATVVGVGAPVAAGVGVLMAAKTWLSSKKLSASMPAYRYVRQAEQKWLDGKSRAPLFTRAGAGITRIYQAAVSVLTSPLRFLPRKGNSHNDTTIAPSTTQQQQDRAFDNSAAEDFSEAASAISAQRTEAARVRAEARARRKQEKTSGFN